MELLEQATGLYVQWSVEKHLFLAITFYLGMQAQIEMTTSSYVTSFPEGHY